MSFIVNDNISSTILNVPIPEESLFSDEMLRILLQDNIHKEYEKIKEERKKN